MTVEELIEFLQKYPKNIPVYVDIAYVSDIKVEHVSKSDLVEEAILITRDEW